MKTIKTTITLATMAVAGCVSTGAYYQLPPRDQALFQRCGRAIEPARCGTITSTTYETMCMRQAAAEYAASPEREEWLVAYGCPPSMVQPDAYLSRGVGQ